ncbi:MAG: BlaI/MecI/CopY family transcriptional regulator [Planctomycetes bacterium]|nr:BlaI/MecI/CopY family transcriptional regulator [Planctomycetota bacterium]
MARKPQDVTDAELAVLQALWDGGTASARELTLRLYRRLTESNLATVQKLLKRLEDKDCISRNREAWPHVFTAAVGREELIGRRLQTTADALCEGALSPLLTHLVKTRRLSPQDRQALRDLLDELEDEGGRKDS